MASNTVKRQEKHESGNHKKSALAASVQDGSGLALAAVKKPLAKRDKRPTSNEGKIHRPTQSLRHQSQNGQRETVPKHTKGTFSKPVTHPVSTYKANGRGSTTNEVPYLGKGRKRGAPELTKGNQPASKRQTKQTIVTGAYRAYYQRRVGDASTEQDDRLPLIQGVLEKISRPAVLDVGCNDGTLTLNVGRLGTSQVVGVEVDSELIKRARKSLYDLVFAEKDAEKQRSKTDVLEKGEKVGEKADISMENGNTTHHAEEKFPFNVTFRCEDFAKDGRTANEKGKYDVVLCLSVTKWVHIAHGDEGLMRFFATIRDCLKDDGCLILEPQLARSYKLARKRGLAPNDFNLGNSKLKPNQFGKYLLTEGGFARMDMLRDLRKGHSFNRPMMAFYKTKSPDTGEAKHMKVND